MVPPLHTRIQPSKQEEEECTPHTTHWIRSAFAGLSSYYKHPAFTPSFATALLYLTVLSFSGQMVTYLLTTGYTSITIGIARTLAVVLEISATWLAPFAMKRIGPVRSGVWFVNWQVMCLCLGVGCFWTAPIPLLAATGLAVGVMFSRVGLWGFDLSTQILIQEVCSRSDGMGNRESLTTIPAGGRAGTSRLLRSHRGVDTEWVRALLLRLDDSLFQAGPVPLAGTDELRGGRAG